MAGFDQPLPVSGVKVATVPLTSAQLLAIFTTPVTLVAAPGAGLAHIPIHANCVYVAGGTPYTDHAGSINVAVGTLGFLQKVTAGWWDQAASQVIYMPLAGQQLQPVSSWANQAITIAQTTANPTGGNGTALITVTYVTIPTQ